MGRVGLEKFKFGIYLLAPVVTVMLFATPSIHETFMKSRRYIVYNIPKDEQAPTQFKPPRVVHLPPKPETAADKPAGLQ